MPTPFDLVVAVLIAVAYPIWAYRWGWPRMLRAIRSGRPNARVPVYARIIGQQWLVTAVIAGSWLAARRPWSALGFVRPTGWGLGLSAALVLALVVLEVLRARAIARMKPDRLARIRSSGAAIIAFAPHTRAEYAVFNVLSVTAGFCEELVFRGFLLWALRPWLTLGGAALASVASFGFAHAYQGRKGALGAGAVGAVFSGLVILTGSVVPVMILHALMDLFGGRSTYSILRDPGAGEAAA